MTLELGPGPTTPAASQDGEALTPLTPSESRRERRRRRRERNGALNPERNPGRTRKRHLGRWIALIVIAGVAALPITLWSRYSASYVTSRNATVKGSITHVGAQVSGVLASVNVEAGQQVEAGQVLASFEDHQLQANLSRAISQLNEAKAHSSSAATRIDAAHTQRAEANTRYQQRVPLAKSGAIALDELRTAETRLRTAEAVERAAISDHQEAGAEIKTAEAEVELARAELRASTIRAPAAGQVVRRIGEPGTSVRVGQPILDLQIGKEVWVEAWIDQSHLSKVAVGNDAKVTVSSFPGRTFHGKVASIGVSTDFELPENAVPQSRRERIRTSPVLPVRVRLDESEGLLPGLTAVVAIQRSDAKGKAPKATAAKRPGSP